MSKAVLMKAGLVVLLMVAMATGSLTPGYGAGKNDAITGSSAHDKITLLEVADTPDPFSPKSTNATFTGKFQVKETDGLGSADDKHNTEFRFFIRHTLVISNALNYQEVNTLIGETNVIAPPKEKGKDGDKKYFPVTVTQLWNGLDAQGNIVTDGTYQYTITGELYRENLKHKAGQDKEPKIKLIGASNSLAGTISVDTAPPIVSIIPAQNAVVPNHTPLIVVNYTDASGVDLSTLKIIFNNIDLTSQFSVTSSQATYQIPEKLPDGLYTIAVAIKDILGHSASLTTTFSVVSAVGVVTPAAGGTVVVTEAGSPLINSAIEIPPGAVAEAVSAVISAPLPADVPPPPAGTTTAGPAVKLDVSPQITFISPITIKIPYSEALVTAAGGNEANVKLIKFDTATNQWVNVPATVDTANNLVVAQVTSLSLFQTVIPTTQTVTKTEYGSIVEISGPVQMPVDTDYHIVLSATTSAPIYQWSLKQNGVVVAGQGFVFGNTLYKDIPFNKSVSGDYIYLFSFRGVSGAHGWPPYTTVSITVTVLPTIPIAPSDLVATPISSSQIDIAWTDNSNNEQEFKIWRLTEVKTETGWEKTEYVQVATVGPNVTSYSDTNLLHGSYYQYCIKASNPAGDSGYSNEANATTYPVAPINLVATVISHKQVNLNWVNVSDNYNILIGIERSTDGTNYESIGGGTAGLFDFSDYYLEANTTYYYRAWSSNRTGPSEDYSNVASTTTLVLTIPEASVRVTALYNAQLITGTDLYNFLIDRLDQANTFYNSGNFNDAIVKVYETFDKILDEMAEGIEYNSACSLSDYVSDLLAGIKKSTDKTPQDQAREKIDDSAKDADRRIDQNGTLTDTEKAALKDKIEEITRTGKATIAIYAAVSPSPPTLTDPLVAIVAWTRDRMLQAVNGTDTCPEGYSCDITIDWEKPVTNQTTGTIEIPKEKWNRPPLEGPSIRIEARGPEGSSISATFFALSSFPAKYYSPISLKITPVGIDDSNTSDSVLQGRAIADFSVGEVCDITYVKMEIIDAETGKIICGEKLMIHLAE